MLQMSRFRNFIIYPAFFLALFARAVAAQENLTESRLGAPPRLSIPPAAAVASLNSPPRGALLYPAPPPPPESYFERLRVPDVTDGPTGIEASIVEGIVGFIGAWIALFLRGIALYDFADLIQQIFDNLRYILRGGPVQYVDEGE